MPEYDQQSLVAVLEQKLKDLERRVASMENTSKILVLLVLTSVIGTALRAMGIS